MTFEFAPASYDQDNFAVDDDFRRERPRVIAPQSRPFHGSSGNVVIFEKSSARKINAVIVHKALWTHDYYQPNLPRLRRELDIVEFYAKRLRKYVDKPQEVDRQAARQIGNEESVKALPLDTRFTPSSRLLYIWIESLEAYATEAFPDRPQLTRLVTKRSDIQGLSREFSSILYSSIAQYASVKSYTAAVFNLSIGGRFLSTFQSKILSDLSILPDEGTIFFRLLAGELMAYLSEGNRFAGGWGELQLSGGGDFQLAATRVKVRKPKGFVASDED